jgi:hypothetical protein
MAPALFALTRRKYHGLAARPGTFSLDSSLPFRSHQKKAGGAVRMVGTVDFAGSGVPLREWTRNVSPTADHKTKKLGFGNVR